MDYDIWSARLAAAKRQPNLQHHRRSIIHHHNHPSSANANHHLISRLDRLNIDDRDVEEEDQQHFPCPYCYQDFEIASLCFHLTEEHAYESKITRRHRSRRDSIPRSQAPSVLRRDLGESHLRALIGGSGSRSNHGGTSNLITDPLHSSLVMDFPTSEIEEISKSMVSTLKDTINTSTVSNVWKSRFDTSLSHEERQRRIHQAAERAVFVQDLFVSCLLEE